MVLTMDSRSGLPVGLRWLTLEDLPAVLDIERQSYSYPWSQGIFQDTFRAGYLMLGVESDGWLAGYAVLAILFDEAHLLNLCVRPASRGQGHARVMLRTLVEVAGQRDLQRLVLEVRDSNRAARQLYQDEGFVLVGRRPGYYPDGGKPEDAVVMALALAGPAVPVH